MLSDEEKKAIDELIARREYFEYNKEGCNYHLSFDEWETEEIIDVILNLIEKQSKEKEKLLKYKTDKIEKLERQIKIKDNYFDMIYFVGADYDGYEKAKDLKSVIDDLVDYAIKGKNNDDKSQIYMNGSGKPENILFEGIKE